MPSGMPMTLDARNAGMLNRSNGISGSVARRSMKTNATSNTTLAASEPTITGEPHP